MNFNEAIPRTTIDSTEVASEDEGTMATLEDIVCLEGVFSKGTAKEAVRTQFHYHPKNPKPSLFVQLFSFPKNRIKKDCAVYFQDLYWNTKNKLIRFLLDCYFIRIKKYEKYFQKHKDFSSCKKQVQHQKPCS
jgi:hypothetical protein